MNETSSEPGSNRIPEYSSTKRIRIPAFVVYAVFILGLIVTALILFPKICSFQKDIRTRFQESLVEVKHNQGDVLEVATYKSMADFNEEDKLDTTVLGIIVPLGTTKSFLRVPVTYRFHVLLSGRWKLMITPETVTVIAPEIRPSLPPAPDISALEVHTESGWARFNKNEVEARLKAMVTPELSRRAKTLAKSEIIRDAARHSVEDSLKNFIRWLPQESKKKVFVVKFEGEVSEAARRQTTPQRASE